MVGHLKGPKNFDLRLFDAWVLVPKNIRNPNVGEKNGDESRISRYNPQTKNHLWKFEIQEKQRFSQDFRPETLEPLEVVFLGQNFYPKL